MEYRLKAKRVEQGIKQIDLARQVGITPQYLNSIEKMAVEPRRDLIVKICNVLGASPVELFFYQDYQTTTE